MTKNSQPGLAHEEKIYYNRKMTAELYKLIMKRFQKRDFRTIQFRLALCLLTVTKTNISSILILKVKDLKTLYNQNFINVKNTTLLIPNQKIRQIVTDRRADFQYIYKIKSDNDYIFTNEIQTNIPMRRETLTRMVNKNLKLIIMPQGRLTSRNFQLWSDQ